MHDPCSFIWKLTAVLPCVLFAQLAMAQQPLYIYPQDAPYLGPYFEPGPPTVPQINAVAFDNENEYDVTYDNIINNQIEFCEPWWYTVFFTNNGTMTVNLPVPLLNTGVGFEFDTQTGNANAMAGTFYNAGTIRCDYL